MNNDIFTKIQKMASEKFNVDLETIKQDKDIFETLKINSVDVLSLLTELETHFSIEIPDYELQDVKTFGDLTRIISERL